MFNKKVIFIILIIIISFVTFFIIKFNSVEKKEKTNIKDQNIIVNENLISKDKSNTTGDDFLIKQLNDSGTNTTEITIKTGDKQEVIKLDEGNSKLLIKENKLYEIKDFKIEKKTEIKQIEDIKSFYLDIILDAFFQTENPGIDFNNEFKEKVYNDYMFKNNIEIMDNKFINNNIFKNKLYSISFDFVFKTDNNTGNEIKNIEDLFKGKNIFKIGDDVFVIDKYIISKYIIDKILYFKDIKELYFFNMEIKGQFYKYLLYVKDVDNYYYVSPLLYQYLNYRNYGFINKLQKMYGNKLKKDIDIKGMKEKIIKFVKDNNYYNNNYENDLNKFLNQKVDPTQIGLMEAQKTFKTKKGIYNAELLFNDNFYFKKLITKYQTLGFLNALNKICKKEDINVKNIILDISNNDFSKIKNCNDKYKNNLNAINCECLIYGDILFYILTQEDE